MRTMRTTLLEAAAQFRSYEAHHREKAQEGIGRSTDEINDSATKAGRNGEMAQVCEEVALARPYQARVAEWMLQCFGAEIASDMVERGDRLLEEVFELLQALGYDFARIPVVAAYVAARDVGEKSQEVGGSMVCLAALCNAAGIDLGEAAETELTRIMDPEVMAKIRAKQAAKPKMSPAAGTGVVDELLKEALALARSVQTVNETRTSKMATALERRLIELPGIAA